MQRFLLDALSDEDGHVSSDSGAAADSLSEEACDRDAMREECP